MVLVLALIAQQAAVAVLGQLAERHLEQPLGLAVRELHHLFLVRQLLMLVVEAAAVFP